MKFIKTNKNESGSNMLESYFARGVIFTRRVIFARGLKNNYKKRKN